MARGHAAWNAYSNDLWHWFKHASPLHVGKIAIPAEIPGIKSEHQYVAVAREICRMAAAGHPGTALKVRSNRHGESWSQDYLIWYQPTGIARGLFLVIKDCGDHGELETMFPPPGKDYFDAQAGEVLH